MFGNHDYEEKDVVSTILKQSNFVILEDKAVNIDIDNNKLKIIGLGDLWRSGDNFKDIYKKENVFTILMSHNPDIFPELPPEIQLTLSGHTHGGELAIPFWGAFFVPSKYGNKYRKGFYKENDKLLFVTSGIGSISGLRFFNIPEICEINIK